MHFLYSLVSLCLEGSGKQPQYDPEQSESKQGCESGGVGQNMDRPATRGSYNATTSKLVAFGTVPHSVH